MTTVDRIVASVGFVLVLAAVAHPGLGDQPFCLPDTNGDGHPLFGGFTVRASNADIPAEDMLAFATSLCTGDFDADGDQDIAVTNFVGDYNPEPAAVSVFLNFGDGVFADEVQFDGGPDAKAVQAGDIDSDGDLDLVVANAVANTCTVLFNDGQAHFDATVTYSVGMAPRSLVVEDLNGDSHLDIAVLNMTGQDVSVLLNDGTGAFLDGGVFSAGNATTDEYGGVPWCASSAGPFIDAGDVDGDGDVDLAIPAGWDVSLLLNSGAATFAELSVVVGAGGTVWAVALGDMNGDAALDLVTTNGSWARISVLLNLGGTAFSPAAQYSVDYMNDPANLYKPSHVALGDLDHDGDLDVCVSMGDRIKDVLFFNDGDGTLTPTAPELLFFDVGHDPWLALFDEFNGDGFLDLATINWSSGTALLTILFGDSTGSLLGHEEFPVSFRGSELPQYPWQNTSGVGVADLDGDADLDLAIVNGGSDNFLSSVSVSLNPGDGSFETITVYEFPYTPSEPFTAGFGGPVRCGDFDGDGDIDLAVADSGHALGSYSYAASEGSALWLLFNDGAGAFTEPFGYPLTNAGGHPMGLDVGDLDGDSDLDIVVGTPGANPNISPYFPGRVRVFTNDGAGSFSETFSFEMAASWPRWPAVALGDFDGDRDSDIAAHNGEFSGDVRILLNAGDATFVLAGAYPVLTYPTALRAVDLDNDGDADLLVGNTNGPFFDLGGPTFAVLLNDGAAGFGTPAPYFIPGWSAQTKAIEATDFNADGWPDLVIGNVLSVSVVYNDSGALSPGRSYNVPAQVKDIAIGDLDQDGDQDLAVANQSSHNVIILRNRICVTQRQGPGDVNGDGAVDLDDFALFLACLGGPDSAAVPAACAATVFSASDLDADADVDVYDAALLFALFAP